MELITMLTFGLAAIAVLYVLYKLVKGIGNVAVALVINSLVGAGALVFLKLVGVAIPTSAPVLLSILFFGLGGLGTVLLLLLFGVKI